MKRSTITAVAGFAVLVTTAMPAMAQTLITVTPSNTQGWGDDPYHTPIHGTQAITTTAPRDGSGSLEMSVRNNASDQTGYGLFSAVPLGSLASLSDLAFDWRASAPGLQSPTMRLYFSVVNPWGETEIGQLGWYDDGSINGTFSTDTWHSDDLMDGDGNNKFFMRFFGHDVPHPLSGGQLATSCDFTDRGSDFNARMQSISAWESACNGSTATTLNLSTAQVYAVSLDMGRWGAAGGTTVYDDQMDDVLINFGHSPADAKIYNFEPNAVTATPEPATLVLMVTGLAGLGMATRRRKTKNV